MRVTCWAVEQEGAAEWRIGMGILYSEVRDHFLQLLTLLKVLTGLVLFPLQLPIRWLLGIWKFFPFGNVFLCLLQATSSIVYRSKENAITSIVIAASQSMSSTFSVVLCWDQNDFVRGASNKQLCQKETSPWLTLNTDNKGNFFNLIFMGLSPNYCWFSISLYFCINSA